MKTPIRTLVAALGVAALSACVAPMGAWPPAGAGANPYGYTASQVMSAPPAKAGSGASTDDYPLMSRDGGVVEAREPGSVVEGEPSHDVQPTASGRMYILELYQEAIDARDALQLEVAALDAALQRTQAELEDTQGALASAESGLRSAEEERDRLRQENADLAARLVTAQIRRLEAEKVLLESKIEWFREAETTAPANAAPMGGVAPAEGSASPPASESGSVDQ